MGNVINRDMKYQKKRFGKQVISSVTDIEGLSPTVCIMY